MTWAVQSFSQRKCVDDVKTRTIRNPENESSQNLEETILICEKAAPEEVLRYALERNISQIVQETSPHHEIEVKSSMAMMDAPASFFDFPLATILTPDKVTVQSEKTLRQLEIPFFKSDEKEAILDSIGEYMRTLAGSGTLESDVRLVADELFTNAIFNAGFQTIPGGANRADSIILDQKQTCRLLVGSKDDRLVVVCEDLFGTLNILKLLNRIRKCYEEGAHNSITWDQPGAGIGSYLVFKSCMSVYYAVQENERTMVACVFPLRKGMRARSEIGKGVHFVNVSKKDKA